jgi:hypothetical protein
VILATLIVGGITAYWFGLRPGAWAAAATFVLCLAAVFRPDLATAINVLIALGVVVVCLLGPRQERPPDAVRATRWVRGAIGQAVALVRALASARKNPPSDKN